MTPAIWALRQAMVAALEAVDEDEDRCGCRCCDVDTVMPLVETHLQEQK